MEDFITYGTVKWNNNYQIEVNKIPGIVKKDEEDNTGNNYIFDIKKEKKIYNTKEKTIDNTL